MLRIMPPVQGSPTEAGNPAPQGQGRGTQCTREKERAQRDQTEKLTQKGICVVKCSQKKRREYFWQIEKRNALTTHINFCVRKGQGRTGTLCWRVGGDILHTTRAKTNDKAAKDRHNCYTRRRPPTLQTSNRKPTRHTKQNY